MEVLLHGIILAFGLILPLGVQNVFIFNQGALHKRFTGALPAVVTAGICDTILISLAVAGVSIVVLSFDWLLLFAAGAVFLAYMGWQMWKSRPEPAAGEGQGSFTAKRQIAFAASVSLLNPHAIMDTIGVIGTSSLAYEGYEKVLFSAGCIGVSWIWFLGLAFAGRKLGQIDKNGKVLGLMNKISALIFWAMAIYMVGQLI